MKCNSKDDVHMLRNHTENYGHPTSFANNVTLSNDNKNRMELFSPKCKTVADWESELLLNSMKHVCLC